MARHLDIPHPERLPLSGAVRDEQRRDMVWQRIGFTLCLLSACLVIGLTAWGALS